MGTPGYNQDRNTPNSFNDLLDDCIRDVESGLITYAECVARHPEHPELANLLRIALAVNKMPRPQMSAAFTAATQQRLQAHLRQRARASRSVQPRQPRGGWFFLRRLFASLLVMALIIVGGGYGLARAASNALPGDTLYSVKRTVEQGELLFATAQTRPAVLYHIASNRLTEVDGLSSRKITISDQFINETVESVTVALIIQTDAAAKTHLTTQALSSITQAAALGAVSPSVAQQTIAKLQITTGVVQNNSIDQQATGTAAASTIAQNATPLSTFTPTTVPTQAATEPAVQPSTTATPSFTPTATHTINPAENVSAAQLTMQSQQTSVVATLTKIASKQATRVPPSATPTLGQGPARVLTGIPTKQQATAQATSASLQAATQSATSEAMDSATSNATIEGTPSEVATGEATEAATSGATATFTETATIAPTATHTPTSTFTPTNTATLPPTATPTATPNGLPAASFKQTWQQITFHDCPPEGQGGNKDFNQTRNRVDDGNYQQVPFDTLAGVTWPTDAQGKPRDQWLQAAKDEIGRSEGLPLSIEAYVIKVQENDVEVQNCNSKDFKTWQLWLVNNPNDEQSKALVVQITPRVREKHQGWTLDKLNTLASGKAKVRVGGWLVFNADSAGDVGKSRKSLWELHPVMQFGVSKNDQWVNLDDFQQ